MQVRIKRIGSAGGSVTTIYTWIVCLIWTVLGHILFPFTDINLMSIVTMFIIALILMRCLLVKTRLYWSFPVFVYIIWLIVSATRGNVTILEIMLPLMSIVVCIWIGSQNVFDLVLARRIIESIAIVATSLLLLQVVVHAMTGVHIPMLIGDMLPKDVAKSYGSSLRAGMDIYGQYRPSCIFIEPSHYVQYVTVALISVLFPNEGSAVSIKKAIFISFGMIITISSTGIALVLIFWSIYICKEMFYGKRKSRVYVLLLLPLLIGMFILMASSNSLLGVYIQRILPSNFVSTVAEQGDRFWSMRYLNDFNQMERIIGRGMGTEPAVYFTGYTRTLYCRGIIGVISIYLIVIDCFRKTTGFSKWMCVAYGLLFYVAEFDGFRTMIFYLTFVFASYKTSGSCYGEKKI